MAVLNDGAFPDTHIDLSFSIFIVLKVYFTPTNAGKPSATILGPAPPFRNGFEAFFMRVLSDLHFLFVWGTSAAEGRYNGSL